MREEEIRKFEHTIYTQLRTLGVVLNDDAGNLIKPGSGEEHRVVSHIARSIAQNVVGDFVKLRRAVEKVCSDTDWCPVCEHHPSSGHHKTCVLTEAAGHCQTDVRESSK